MNESFALNRLPFKNVHDTQRIASPPRLSSLSFSPLPPVSSSPSYFSPFIEIATRRALKTSATRKEGK